jgi:peptidoglycan/xylan/chitin deacetylase (PgdA/CDA1 family)
MTVLAKIARRFTAAVNLKPKPSRLTAPVASICFDDFPRSAVTLGAQILEDRGLLGTYYMTGRYRDAEEGGRAYFRTGDLQTLEAAGHEIGCHSFSHPRFANLSEDGWEDELERNRALLAAETSRQGFSTFAYPYGETSLRAKRYFSARFDACRGVADGVNHGVLDLSQLKAIGVETRRWRARILETAIARAWAHTGWVIFFTHDISADPSPYGARPQMLEQVLDALAAAQVEVLPVKDALARAVGG